MSDSSQPFEPQLPDPDALVPVDTTTFPTRPRRIDLRRAKDLYDRITAEVGKIYVGQDELVLSTLVALFSSGHVLIESVPGLGKTLFVRTLGQVLGCKFGRIQF